MLESTCLVNIKNSKFKKLDLIVIGKYCSLKDFMELISDKFYLLIFLFFKSKEISASKLL